MAKKVLNPISKCTECIHAELHRWMSNPVISICKALRGERFVASVTMRCPLYKHFSTEFGATAPTVTIHSSHSEGPVAH